MTLINLLGGYCWVWYQLSDPSGCSFCCAFRAPWDLTASDRIRWLACKAAAYNVRSRTVLFVVAGVLSVAVSWSVQAQTIVPSQNGVCPSGSTSAGSGYCRSTSGRGFIPSDRGSCPSGTSSAGAGYCATDGHTTYVPATRGSCPSGTTSAGSGYCRSK